MALSSPPSTLNASAAAVPLTRDHLRAFAAWLAHGPCTVHQLAAKSDLPLTYLHPLTLELGEVGGLRVAGQASTGPVYVASIDEVNAPSATDVVERQLTTLSVADRVSIAAGIMAKYGPAAKRAKTRTAGQTELL